MSRTSTTVRSSDTAVRYVRKRTTVLAYRRTLRSEHTSIRSCVQLLNRKFRNFHNLDLHRFLSSWKRVLSVSGGRKKMSVLLRRFPMRNVATMMEHPRIAKARTTIGNLKPVQFLGNVINDYKSVGKDTIQDAKARPWRSTLILATLSVAYLAFLKNPTERSFVDGLLESNNDLIQVPASARNSHSERFLVEAQRFRNAERLRCVNVGLFSLILHEDFNRSCDVYEAHCKYLMPSFFVFYERLVDVGVFNRWWKLEKAMKDFDVNMAD